ncbi:MAG TPA: polysaccharide lyase family 7 protein [Candidatus Baltobacteraceae bacterium]
MPTGGPNSLNPNVAPGGNFDLSIWSIQLPIGTTGKPTTIPNTQLEGASGFQDTYFQTDTSNGAMAFDDPSKGCVTTPNSVHCRSELSEVDPSSGIAAAWSASGTNTMTATLLAGKISTSVVVGQIHITESQSVRPYGELFYALSGALTWGQEQTPAGGNEKSTSVGSVAVGTKFTYVISFSKGAFSVSINGKATSIAVPAAFPSTFTYYFKAGDYGQGSADTTDEFFALNVAHS